MTNKRAAEVLSMAVTFNGCGRCTGDEMREAVKMACATLEATEWISVKDRLPEYRMRALAYADNGAMFAASHYDDWYVDTGENYYSCPLANITHWMPLPQPPKEDA